MLSSKTIQYEEGISESHPALRTNRYNCNLLDLQPAGAIDSVVPLVSGIATSPTVWNLIKRKAIEARDTNTFTSPICRDSVCKEWTSRESPKDVEPGSATCQSRRYLLV